jgi:hypothetical protein
MGTTLGTTVQSAADSAGASATSAAASARYVADALANIESDVNQAETAKIAAEAARANAEYHATNYIPGPPGPQGPASTVPGPQGEIGPAGKALEPVHHGTDPNVARPDHPVVYWIGTANPVNAQPTDFWLRENI